MKAGVPGWGHGTAQGCEWAEKTVADMGRG